MNRLPWSHLLWRSLGFAALWWVLSEGESRAWGLGVLTVGAAVAASLWLWRPPRRLPGSLPGLLGFLAFFLWQSVRGGLMVAALALRPRLRLQPSLQEWTLRLPPGHGRVLLADAMTLTPGTCSARLEGDRLHLHALDVRFASEAQLRITEHRLARALGLEMRDER